MCDTMLMKDICAIVTDPGNYCMTYIREPEIGFVTCYDYTSSMIFNVVTEWFHT